MPDKYVMDPCYAAELNRITYEVTLSWEIDSETGHKQQQIVCHTSFTQAFNYAQGWCDAISLVTGVVTQIAYKS